MPGRASLHTPDLSVPAGGRVGVIGPNGSGKSTLLRVISGTRPADQGEVRIAPGATVGLLQQQPQLDPDRTAGDVVAQGVSGTLALLARHQRISSALEFTASPTLLAELADLEQQLASLHGWDVDARISQAMAALGCPPAEVDVGHLSGGERRRVDLCRVLLSDPDVLLLDEPTNELDAAAIEWLEHYLKAFRGTAIVATHDRQLLDGFAESILEIDHGGLRRYKGGYTAYLASKVANVDVHGGKDAQQLQLLRTELVWATSTSAIATDRGRDRDDTQTRPLLSDRPVPGLVRIPPGPRLGHEVVTLSEVTKWHGDRLLIDALTFSLPPGALLGVIGPNGSGKTTMLRMIAGMEPPTSGTIKVSASVTIAYTDQERSRTHYPEATPAELIHNADAELPPADPSALPARAHLAAFGFRGADQDRPVRAFSGGEQARLNLALTLRRGGNLLLLDEPTNDLDTMALAALEASLREFPGCAVIASHDRWHLSKLATHILAWEGTETTLGRWHWHDGGLADYLDHYRQRTGISPRAPLYHRFPDR